MARTDQEPGRPSLRMRLARTCAEVAPQLSGTAAAVVSDVLQRLDDPTLRIAVGGRLNAGKSTLVNTFLTQRLAPTDATECTRLVTWFRYGTAPKVRVRPFNGPEYPRRPGPDLSLPADLGLPADEIAEVIMETPNDALRNGFSIIDTPGTDSLTGLDDYALSGLRHADVLLYVMPHPGANDDKILGLLQGTMAEVGLSAVNVLGVLSQIDRLTGGVGDPWPKAEDVAKTNVRRLRTVVVDIVPLLGLVAETVLGERFTEEDARLLRLVAAVEPDQRDFVLNWLEEFTNWGAGPLTQAERERLLGLLDLSGIRIAIGLIDAGASDTPALMAGLREASGVDRLLATVRREFVDRADQLRTAAAVAALDRVAWGDQNTALVRLRAELSALGREPAIRAVWLGAAAARERHARGLALDPDADGALSALITGRDDRERLGLPDSASARDIARAADEQIGRWRELEGGPPLSRARLATRARELTESLYFNAVSAP
jgi:Dynamin family